MAITTTKPVALPTATEPPKYDHFDCPTFTVELPDSGAVITNAMNGMRLERNPDNSVKRDPETDRPLVIEGSLKNLENNPVHAVDERLRKNGGRDARVVIAAAGVNTILHALQDLKDTMTVAEVRKLLTTAEGQQAAGTAIYKGIADAIYDADPRAPTA